MRFRPVLIRGHYLPPDGSERLAHPAPFTVFCDTRYERTLSKVHGKAAHEFESVYNVCAWIQHLQNRVLKRELDRSEKGRPVSVFDRESRVGLHQLFVSTNARCKALELATTDGPASETLRAQVCHEDDGAYCPAYDACAAAPSWRTSKTLQRPAAGSGPRPSRPRRRGGG